jgi:hypothetical protein
MHSYCYWLNRSIVLVLEKQSSYISYICIQNLNVTYVRHNSVPYHTRTRAIEFSADGKIQYWGATLIAVKQ